IYYNPAVRYLPWRSATDTSQRMAAASFTKAWFDPLDTSGNGKAADLSAIASFNTPWCTTSARCDWESRDFNPAIVYLLNAGADPTVKANYTKFDLNGSANPNWGRSTYSQRTDCVTSATCTLAEERQNFANWFTYHRTRILFTKGALAAAFAPLGTGFRLGWGSTQFARSNNTVDGKAIEGGPTQGVREFSEGHKKAFLNWLYYSAKLSGSTPLRYAMHGVGEYFRRTDNGSPWRTQPESGKTTPLLSCRRAAHIMTTDGYYNDEGGWSYGDYAGRSDAVGEVDASKRTENGQTYTPTVPYADSVNSNSLADIAMRYYAFPLISNQHLANPNSKVPPIEGKDPADWLHLNQFMVGMGVDG